MTKGVFDISTIGFGPGLEEHAHTVQDQVKEADLVKAQEFYAGRYVIYLRLSGVRYSFMIIKLNI